MNANGKHRLSWIRRNNHKQREWAAEYLRKRGVSMDQVRSYEELIACIDLSPDGPGTREFVSNMRKAWNQKKYRDEPNGKQSVNFNISPEARKRLRQSAKQAGMRMNEMLEKLIGGASVGCVESGGSEATLDQDGGVIDGGGQAPPQISNKLAEPPGYQLWKICRYEVLLYDAGISDHALTETQHSRVAQLFRERGGGPIPYAEPSRLADP